MIVFEANKCFQKIMDIHAMDIRRGFILVPIIVSVSMSLVLLSLSSHFVLNLHEDFNRAWYSLPPIFGYVSTILVYWHFLINGNRFKSLLAELQDIVVESAYGYWLLTYQVRTHFGLVFKTVELFQEWTWMRIKCCMREHTDALKA